MDAAPDAARGDERYLIAGVSRLAVRVARLLVARGSHVTVLGVASDDLVGALPDAAETVIDDRAHEHRLAGAGLVVAPATRRS